MVLGLRARPRASGGAVGAVIAGADVIVIVVVSGKQSNKQCGKRHYRRRFHLQDWL